MKNQREQEEKEREKRLREESEERKRKEREEKEENLRKKYDYSLWDPAKQRMTRKALKRIGDLFKEKITENN